MLAESLSDIPLETLGLVGGLSLGALFILFLALVVFLEERRKIAQTRERENSRREIAAYVAEGSISAQDAARLLNDKGKSLGDAISEAIS
jgi:HAMP domain-containing protein